MTQKGLLNIRDVMRILNVSRRTIYNWIDKGLLQPIKLGKIYRFHPDDIDSLIENSRSVVARKKGKILTIDDDLLVRKSLKILLEKAGFDVTVVASGRQALETLQEQTFDLVLTDIRMPEMDGISVLKAIRKVSLEEGKPEPKEIVMSGYNDNAAQVEMEQMGITNFVAKPFDWDQFIQMIKMNLN